MKMFNDSHLEVKKFFKGTFFTHPYEAGWADEAIFFVMVEKIEGDPVFEGRVQLSQDGIYIGLTTVVSLQSSKDLANIL